MPCRALGSNPASPCLHSRLTPRRVAHLRLTGDMRFLPSAAASASGSPGAAQWHGGRVEAYISAQPPSLVCNATISLGPLSWVKGFVSMPHGSGGAWQWKLCSPMRMRDLGGGGGPPVGLDQPALAAYLAGKPGCCALLRMVAAQAPQLHGTMPPGLVWLSAASCR